MLYWKNIAVVMIPKQVKYRKGWLDGWLVGYFFSVFGFYKRYGGVMQQFWVMVKVSR